MGHSEYDPGAKEGRPWNAGRKHGGKRALKPQQVWAIRFWLDRERRLRDRAMFDLAIDSKLRGCDVVKVKIGDLISGGRRVRPTRVVGAIAPAIWPRPRPGARLLPRLTSSFGNIISKSTLEIRPNITGSSF